MWIINENPNYFLFENNCQIFVKLLLEAVSPGAPIPETTKCLVQRLLDLWTVSSRDHISLPGAYPRFSTESQSTESQSFATASETTFSSFVTAPETHSVADSGATWVSVIESVSSESQSHFRAEAKKGERGLGFTVMANLATLQIRLHRRTALHRAVRQRDLAMVKALLKLKADVSARDGFGRTPLHCAVKENNDPLVSILLHVVSRTPLHCTVEQNNRIMTNILLQAIPEATPRKRNGSR
jgi:ankyrin repeat protein